MKITRNTKFEPINILLETKEEAKILHEITMLISGNRDSIGRSFTESIQDGLRSFGISSSEEYFHGDIPSK